MTLKEIIEDDNGLTGAKLIMAMGERGLYSSEYVHVSPTPPGIGFFNELMNELHSFFEHLELNKSLNGCLQFHCRISWQSRLMLSNLAIKLS